MPGGSFSSVYRSQAGKRPGPEYGVAFDELEFDGEGIEKGRIGHGSGIPGVEGPGFPALPESEIQGVVSVVPHGKIFAPAQERFSRGKAGSAAVVKSFQVDIQFPGFRREPEALRIAFESVQGRACPYKLQIPATRSRRFVLLMRLSDREPCS
jgi:hypothetical protein